MKKLKTFEYKKTRALYIVTGEVQMKHPVTRKWVRAYVYAPVSRQPYETEPLSLYVREQKDFHEKFIEKTEKSPCLHLRLVAETNLNSKKKTVVRCEECGTIVQGKVVEEEDAR